VGLESNIVRHDLSDALVALRDRAPEDVEANHARLRVVERDAGVQILPVERLSQQIVDLFGLTCRHDAPP
jgi:hypothetical protein